jgi:hypothetical protein
MNDELKAWASRARVRVRVTRRRLRAGAAGATVVCLCVGAPLVRRARAEGATATPDVSEDKGAAREAADPGRFLPGALTPATGSALAAGFSWAGYDGATRDPLFGAAAEARLGSRVVIGAGVTYAAATSLHPGAVRSSVGARLQVLDQQCHGLDAGVGFAFRQDRFVEEEGFLEAALTIGWRSDRATLLGNLGYGQDGEGDDHEGELRLAGLYRVTGSLHVGLDGRVRRLLDSTDPNRAAHGTPSLEIMAGPVAALMIGPVAVVLETGVSGVRRGSMETGLLTIGSLGAAF